MILSEKDLQFASQRSTPSTTPPSSTPSSESTDSNDSESDRKVNEVSIEFDGTTVLCRVCGDKASGFHYGVHSCEGCKGFFRRSIQQKIQYRPCTKNQQCSILRINRNRCQYCRLKKCIAVGMSRDAVRFGRVPKREKAKILAAMQKVNANSQEKALCLELEDENRLLTTIIKAHEETCDYTREKVAPLIEKSRTQPVYAHCPPQMACPLNPMPQHVIENGGSNRILEDFSERFSPAIRGVVEFAKRIPGFGMLSQDDQVTLLKAGVFEVLLVRLACMFDSHTNSMICLNGLVLRREALHSASNARFLLDSMFDFADRLNSLRLTDQEVGLFCAIVVIAADRPGLRNLDLVQKINRKLDDVLQKAVTSNHPENPCLFNELKKKIPDLRTLNTLHSEKLLAYKMEPRNGQNGQDGHNGGIDTPQLVCNYSSLIPEQWSQFAMMSTNQIKGHIDDDNRSNRSTSSPGQASQPGDWSSSDSKDAIEGLFGSPRSLSMSSNEDISLRSSLSVGNKAMCYMNGESHQKRMLNNNGRQMTQSSHLNRKPMKMVSASVSCPINDTNNHEHSSSTDEMYHRIHSPVKGGNNMVGNANYSKIRRVDSPTDSGIESGKEHGNGSTPTTSVCSSPRSAMDDKVKDVSDSEGSEKQESIDDMPMLKRALQAPPLINTNMLMDEAYRHHKKFRAAARKEGDSLSPSTTTITHTAMPSMPESLASSHSTLLKTLEQPSRYMNEQQLKRTDLIHNIIMRTESVSASSTTSPCNWKGMRQPLESSIGDNMVGVNGGVSHSANSHTHSANSGNFVYHTVPHSHQNGSAVQSVQSTHSLMSPIQQSAKQNNVCPPGYYIPSNFQQTSCPYSTNGALGALSAAAAQYTSPNTRTTKVASMSQSQQPSIASAPRIVFTSSMSSLEAQQQQQHNSYVQHGRSPCSPNTSPAALVIGSTPPPQASTTPHLSMSRSRASSPSIAAILMSQSNNGSDYQPLNLSKKTSI